VKIVFDTNVLFSAFVAHGACAGLYEECLQRAQIVVSPDILRELEEALRVKARLTRAEAQEVIRAVRADSEVVKATPLARQVCRDSDDDRILAAAIAAKADAIVTGDQDLLVLERFKGVTILNPHDCLAMLAAT
jgi:putative PIN family toxin of toxin-antitoxin system